MSQKTQKIYNCVVHFYGPKQKVMEIIYLTIEKEISIRCIAQNNFLFFSKSEERLLEFRKQLQPFNCEGLVYTEIF